MFVNYRAQDSWRSKLKYGATAEGGVRDKRLGTHSSQLASPWPITYRFYD